MKKLFAVFITCMTVWAQVPKKVTLQTFGESDLLLIHTKKGFSTLIEFPEGHGIVEVTCGDKDLWVVEGRGRFLHVKPSKEGLVTNLNVLLDGDVVYSFLLKEVSTKTGIAKPDLRVLVNGGDDVAKLRKDKDNLEEALNRSERALKDLSDKYDMEKKAASKKNDQASEEIKQTPANGGATATVVVAVPMVAAGAGAPVPALAQRTGVPEEAPIASSYVVERQSGIVRTSWRKVKHVFRRIVHGY